MNRITTPVNLPSRAELEKWLRAWDEDEKNRRTVSAMQVLFAKIPTNTDFHEIYVKVVTLNDLYSTNIRKPYDADVARHILSIKDLDRQLQAGDLTIVNQIAAVPITDKTGHQKLRNYYSFATKFCTFSNPTAYSIYDSYVEKILKAFNKIDPFFDPKVLDFRNYADFDKILSLFREKYCTVFAGVSRLDIDKYLWLLGKRTFPKTYLA